MNIAIGVHITGRDDETMVAESQLTSGAGILRVGSAVIGLPEVALFFHHPGVISTPLEVRQVTRQIELLDQLAEAQLSLRAGMLKLLRDAKPEAMKLGDMQPAGWTQRELDRAALKRAKEAEATEAVIVADDENKQAEGWDHRREGQV